MVMADGCQGFQSACCESAVDQAFLFAELPLQLFDFLAQLLFGAFEAR